MSASAWSRSELCRDLGFNSATLYKWRSKYGGMDVSLMAH
ncbi:MAG: transposase [Achromobacter sp.]|nr:transposase [Achromobacter sp.]